MATSEIEATLASRSWTCHSSADIAPSTRTISASAMTISTYSRAIRRRQSATTSPAIGSSETMCRVSRCISVSNSSSAISDPSIVVMPRAAV